MSVIALYIYSDLAWIEWRLRLRDQLDRGLTIGSRRLFGELAHRISNCPQETTATGDECQSSTMMTIMR